jgi:hypothetical protein
MMALNISRSDRLRPWIGHWYFALPEPRMRFVSPTQHTAIQLLRGRRGLSVADAKLLQWIITFDQPLSRLEQRQLDRLRRAHDERLAA